MQVMLEFITQTHAEKENQKQIKPMQWENSKTSKKRELTGGP